MIYWNQVLANLLETEDSKCKFGALRILCQITVHPAIRKKTTLMGGIELLIKILSDPDPDLQLLATETMANLARFRKARLIVRKNGGIPKLVDLLDVDLTKVSSFSLLEFANCLGIKFLCILRYTKSGCIRTDMIRYIATFCSRKMTKVRLRSRADCENFASPRTTFSCWLVLGKQSTTNDVSRIGPAGDCQAATIHCWRRRRGM